MCKLRLKKKKKQQPQPNFFPNENKLNPLKSGKKPCMFGIKKVKQQNKYPNTMFLPCPV